MAQTVDIWSPKAAPEEVYTGPTFSTVPKNPITVDPGETQRVDPRLLRAGDRDTLFEGNINAQKALIEKGIARSSPIIVNTNGNILDGHHGARAAIEYGEDVTVMVWEKSVKNGPPLEHLPILPGMK